MCFWRCDRFESILCKEDDCRAAGRGCRWQFFSSKASTKACSLTVQTLSSLFCNLSIDRERVATWQPNTPLLVIWCFVVDQSSFNKPVLGTMLRGVTGGFDHAPNLTFISARIYIASYDSTCFMYAHAVRAKDARCVSPTCRASTSAFHCSPSQK